MAPGSEDMLYTQLRVVQSMAVPGGPSAAVPGFGATGGSMQYFFEGGIQSWIDRGLLEVLTP